MSELKQAAIYYAKLGWSVFPCIPGGKAPLAACAPHGVKDATTDVTKIINWWHKYPDANIGLACGPKSGVYVVDVDVNDKADGWESINKLSVEGKHLPKTVCQNTPSGGAHFLYKTDNPPRNKNASLPGIDIRSEGYYVVLPPSIHPNGGTYAWAPGLVPGESRWASTRTSCDRQSRQRL